jgi:hypothetical protein
VSPERLAVGFAERPSASQETLSIAAPFAAPPSTGPFQLQPAPEPARLRKAALSPWSASVWVHARTGDTPVLAPAGMLGGGQTGARLRYQVSPGVSLVARASTPLRRAAGAEASLGAEWQPVRTLPIRLLAERRQAIGPEGRSAFALTAHGGVSELPLPLGLRLDAYGQAGAVGAKARDLFAEGSARVAAPVAGRTRVGAAVWAASQPGVRRLDAGPSLSLGLPRLGATLSADWRFRLSGNALPGSGPALSLWMEI